MLFESLDLIYDMQRTASRQAVSMAVRRADLRFGDFLRTSSSADELEARKSLITDDLRSLISATCAEFGYNDTESVLASVEASLGLVHEARRPKMCPFHREVTDISLSTGDPNAGFNSMSQHAFSDSSCRGAWEGSCNWKPEMVKQEYWDKRSEELDQRRQEREQQNMQIQPQGLPENSANPAPEGDELMTDLYQGVDIENALDGAPSAVGGGDLAELGQSESGDVSFDSGPQNTQVVPFLSSTHEAEGPRGTEVVTGDSVEKNESPDMTANSDESFASGLGREPSVGIDERTWTPETVKPIDTDSDTRHPSELQDINQAANYQGNPFEDDGRFDKTQNLTTTEELPSAGFDDAGLNRDITVTPNSDTRTWSEGFGGGSDVLKQQNPVTPQTLSHFLSSGDITKAIATFNGDVTGP